MNKKDVIMYTTKLIQGVKMFFQILLFFSIYYFIRKIIGLIIAQIILKKYQDKNE